MPDVIPLPVGSPKPPPPVNVAPPKDQEDLNIEAYKKTFVKCINVAGDIVRLEVGTSNASERCAQTVDIAKAIFDRFYTDQAAIKQSKQQVNAMMAGLTSVLEGRR